MQIGLGLPQTGPGATREHIATYAQTAEESGYASLWVADHVVVPREYRSLHPSRPGGRLPDRYRPERNLLEPLTLLAFVAGVTERIRIGTSVLVLPMRQPVLPAKIIASIVHLWLAASTASGSTSLADSESAAIVLEGVRRFGVALYLTSITVGLATIAQVLRFQTIRIPELP